MASVALFNTYEWIQILKLEKIKWKTGVQRAFIFIFAESLFIEILLADIFFFPISEIIL